MAHSMTIEDDIYEKVRLELRRGSLVLAVLMGGLVLFQAYVWTGAIP